VTTNLKRLGLGIALAGIASGGAAGSAFALQGETYAPIAGGCGGSVYWNTEGNPIATASVNNPNECTERVSQLITLEVNVREVRERVEDLFSPGPVP
jgi:hypothetical protein